MTGPQLPFGVFTSAAVSLHEMKESFVDAGFTEDQAMDLVKTTIVAMFSAGGGPQ